MTTYTVDQHTANAILKEAYASWEMAEIYADIDDAFAMWVKYNTQAKAYYEAWSMITNIEFENGYLDLAKFHLEDFENIA